MPMEIMTAVVWVYLIPAALTFLLWLVFMFANIGRDQIGLREVVTTPFVALGYALAWPYWLAAAIWARGK